MTLLLTLGPSAVGPPSMAVRLPAPPPAGRVDRTGGNCVSQHVTRRFMLGLPCPAQTDTSFGRLAKLNAPEWRLGVIGCIGSAAAGVMSPGFSFLFASMIAIFYTPDMEKLKRDASFYAGMLAIVGVGGCIAILSQQAAFGIMGARLAKRVRELLFASMLKQEVRVCLCMCVCVSWRRSGRAAAPVRLQTLCWACTCTHFGPAGFSPMQVARHSQAGVPPNACKRAACPGAHGCVARMPADRLV